MSETAGLTYSDAGVNIDAAQEALRRASGALSAARGEGVVGGIGGFGGLFRMPSGLESPLLVASADGVGTKLSVGIAADQHDTVGEDLVNHCVNDILVQGARPMFLLDYIATGKLVPGVVASLIEGFSRGCQRNDCTLLGGETAEMPGTYKDGDYDLAATVVGVVEEAKLLPRADVAAGDVLIGLRSSGLHTNGFSLARKALFERAGLTVHDRPESLGGESVGEALLAVHRTYAPLLLPMIDEGAAGPIKAMAHLTGGGFTDNIPRVLPEGVSAVIETDAWTTPPIFELIRTSGDVPAAECHRAFNMGIGMVLVVAPERVDELLTRLADAGEEGALVVGELVSGDGAVELRGL